MAQDSRPVHFVQRFWQIVPMAQPYQNGTTLKPIFQLHFSLYTLRNLLFNLLLYLYLIFTIYSKTNITTALEIMRRQAYNGNWLYFVQ